MDAYWIKLRNKAVLYTYNLHTQLGDYFAPIQFQGLDPNKKYVLKRTKSGK